MSIRAMNWVWEHSDAAGTELLLLLAIADAADDAGRNAYPSVRTLAAKTRLSERTVQRLIAKLAASQRIIVRASPGGRYANTYTVNLTGQRADEANQSMTGSPAQGSGDGEPAEHALRSPAERAAEKPEVPVDKAETPSTTPVNLSPRQSDTGDTAMSPLGCHSYDTPGVTQLCRPTPPRTVLDPSTTRPVADPTRRTPRPDPSRGGGGHHPTEPGSEYAARDPANHEPTTLRPDSHDSDHDNVDVVVQQIAATWSLGPASRRRLTPAIQHALGNGWNPHRLAEHLTSNPDGVRSPYAVLKARLADLPAPTPTRPPLPTWCGHCDRPDTRMIERPDGRVTPCPTCHPRHSA